MRTPTRFRAETKYTESTGKKANVNLPIMATVGDHLTGTAAVAGRPGWYHIRLGGETVADPNPTVASRLTQCKSEGVGLILNDLIYVIKARDRNLTHYEFHSFIQSTGGLPHPLLYARGIIIPDNTAQAFYVEDDDSVGAGSPEYLRIDSRDGPVQIVALNFGEADVDFRVAVLSTISLTDPTHALSIQGSTGAISMGTPPDPSAHLLILNDAVSTVNAYYGLWTVHQKTLGVTADDDPMYGLNVSMIMNQAGGVIGDLSGGFYHSWLRDGTVGALAQTRNLVAFEAYAQGDAGTVYGDAIGVLAQVLIDGTALEDNAGAGNVYGIRSIVDLDSGTIDGNVYGVHVWVDDDIGATTVYMLYLDEQTGIDWGVYQNGAAFNHFGGIVHSELVVDATFWFDYELRNATEGDHFRQNAAGAPATWAVIDAASRTDTTELYSFWYLVGSNAELSWDYRLQTGIDIEVLAANTFASFQFGPILFRDGGFGADVDYLFAIHGETAAAIDLLEYVRVHLQWDSAGTQWRARGESRAGALDVETASAWMVLSVPLAQPLYIRLMIRNNAVKTTREYMGTAYVPQSQSMFQSVNENTTWGQVYWRISQTRGAGLEDYLLIGAVDYLVDVP